MRLDRVRRAVVTRWADTDDLAATLEDADRWAARYLSGRGNHRPKPPPVYRDAEAHAIRWVAAAASVESRTAKRWLRGDSEPTLSGAARMARALDLTLDDLAGWDDIPPAVPPT